MHRIRFHRLFLCLTWRRQRNAIIEPHSQSLFLELPADIVSYLCQEHLQPASVVALSLACKDLFDLVFPRARLGLSNAEREDLQLLLERDLGHGWWYCHSCSVLHPISAWGPTGGGSYREPERDDCRHDRRSLAGSRFTIGYQTVRLAMNRHFLGPPNGLLLENFEVKGISFSFGSVCWQEKWSAKILQDELFLFSRRTLSGIHQTDEALRAALDNESYEICWHVRTSGAPVSIVKALHCASPGPAGFFVPCHDVVDSCPRCLTDYATTVERRFEDVQERWGRKRTRAYWFITITSYHRLGSGRSPLDPKWQAFAGRLSIPWFQIRRDMVAYPQGAVKVVWEEGD